MFGYLYFGVDVTQMNIRQINRLFRDHDDIPKSVEALIDDFVKRVKRDKTVLRYGTMDRNHTLTDAQVNSLCAAVQKVKNVRAAEKRVSESYLNYKKESE